MINLKEKVSEATKEGKMLKLTLHCARVEVHKKCKVSSDVAQTCSVANVQAQLWVL